MDEEAIMRQVNKQLYILLLILFFFQGCRRSFSGNADCESFLGLSASFHFQLIAIHLPNGSCFLAGLMQLRLECSDFV